MTADDERRAEIEAVARELHARLAHNYSFATCKSFAVRAIDALDRVRDARGDDEGCPDCWGGRPKWAGTMPAPPCPTCGGTGKRSPQGEDHDTARPEQPPPDTLGGQPPAEPPEAP